MNEIFQFKFQIYYSRLQFYMDHLEIILNHLEIILKSSWNHAEIILESCGNHVEIMSESLKVQKGLPCPFCRGTEVEPRLGRGRRDDVDLVLFVPGQATDAPGTTRSPQWHPTGAIAPVARKRMGMLMSIYTYDTCVYIYIL